MEARRQGHRGRLLQAMKCKGAAGQKKMALADFQKLVRLRAADKFGMVVCVTCGARRKWNDEMHGGHFISRTHNATCFHEKNVHPQCEKCNMSKDGKAKKYCEFMRRTYGQDVIDELDRLANTNVSYTLHDYFEFCLDFREKIKAEEQRLKEAM